MQIFSTRSLFTVAVLTIVSAVAGCSSMPAGAKKGRVHTVNIGQQINPLQINAGRGDEVRWMNDRSQPVAVIFPGSDATRLSCRSGFKNLDGSGFSAVVPPNGSASLCFAELGKYDYDVRLDENLPSGQLDRTASVFIVGGGQRNPGPGEQFENITP